MIFPQQRDSVHHFLSSTAGLAAYCWKNKILSFNWKDVEKKTQPPIPHKNPTSHFRIPWILMNFLMGHDCRNFHRPKTNPTQKIRELPGSPKNFPHCPGCHRKIWIEKWCRKAKDQNVSLECANCTTATKLTFLNSKFCFLKQKGGEKKKTWVVLCWLDIR